MNAIGAILKRWIPVVIAAGFAAYGEITNQKISKQLDDQEERIAKLEKEE